MKKIIFLFLLSTAAFHPAIVNGQITTSSSQCDSIQMLYNSALFFLDSLAGTNNSLTKQLEEYRLKITKLQTEISSMVKKKNETTAELNKAKKLISEQMEKIEGLEAKVKRQEQLKKSSSQKRS